jgi:hypothetical protein
MHDFLVQQGMVKALLGKSKKPVTISNEEWEEIDARALGAIRLCLDDDVMFNIVRENTTTSLWTKMEILYMTKSLMNMIFLKRQLYNFHMKESTKIANHLNTFNALLVQLTSMGVKFESEEKEITLLCSLPESWDHFVTSISFNSTESIDFDVIVGSLLSEETRKKFNFETSTFEAMVVRGRPKERGPIQRDLSLSKSKGKKRNIKCWYCGKYGHLKKDCWKRQKASKEDPPKEMNEANTTEIVSATSSSMDDEVLIIGIFSHYDQQWLLDSGASNHMCLHRHWFITYQSIDDGIVYMQAVGIGSIRIKMFDGSIKILTDVRHVPELRKNLISLGVLYDGGYKSIVQGGVMKFYKGILLVMKEKKVGNMFLLEGRTELDHATTVSEYDGDIFRLWHQRLGHMSERGLKVLFDRKLLPRLKSLKLDFCKHCIYGKHNRKRFKTGRHTSEGILDYIHYDVWGPSPTISYGGSSYFVTFIDDFSRKVWIYMLKRKADVFNVFKQFRALVEKSTSRSIKCL